MSRGRLTLGILANELFDLELGRMGGFGWAARQVARVFADPRLGVDVVFVTGEVETDRREVHGAPLVGRGRGIRWARNVRSRGIDLLLAVDYRPSYDHVLRLLPRTPLVVWVRDPQAPEDADRIATLRVPGGAEPAS